MRSEPDRQIAGNSSRRFHLIDLVLAVVFCGLVVATFTSSIGIRKSNFTFLAAAIVGVFWYIRRQTQSGPTCEECGARFYPTGRENERTHCPHCGEPQAAVRQSSMRRGFVILLIAVMTAVCILATITFALDPLRDVTPFERSRLAALLVAAATALSATLAAAWLIASKPRSLQPGVRICEGCGGIIPEKPPAPLICPTCRARKLTHEELKEQQAKSNRSIVLFLGCLSAAAIAGTVAYIRSANEIRIGPMLVVLVLPALVLAFLAWKLIPYLINSRRLLGILGEEAALAKARACSGEDGTIVRVGPITIWYSGTDDPVPILQDEISASHRRLEDLLGETAIADPPLTILCFHDQPALLKLYKSLFSNLDLTAHLGVYLQRPWNIMALCTGAVAGRLDDARSSLGSLYCLVLLEQAFGQLSSPWLQAGLTASLSASHDRGDLCGLNRRMIAAISQKLEWSDSLFTASANQVAKGLLQKSDPRNVRKSELFSEQAWSIVEYLAGEQATETQKSAFRAFVKEKQATAGQEQECFQHFGFGFGSLVEAWRQWVMSQGNGYGEPPSIRVRDALLNRVLPVIQNPLAPRAPIASRQFATGEKPAIQSGPAP